MGLATHQRQYATSSSTHIAVVLFVLQLYITALGEEASDLIKFQFVDNVWDLKSAAHYGVQHIILTEHVDFTPVPLDGWWYHLKAESTLETLQGECVKPPPSVPEDTPPLRLLMPKQCVVLHDADLFGFVTRTPSHLWLAHLYLRVIRSKRSVRPFSITLHDGAWAFLDEVTFQGDANPAGSVGISIAATDQAYLKKCMFADIACKGCATAAIVAGTADFEQCTFDNLQSGNGTDDDGLMDSAAVFVHAYGTHSTHKFGVDAPMLRAEGNIFKNVNPYGILIAEPENPRDPVSIAFLDEKGSAALAPNSTGAGLEDAPLERFLLEDHEWYLAEKEEALAILHGEYKPPRTDGSRLRVILYAACAGAVAFVCAFVLVRTWYRGRRASSKPPAPPESTPVDASSTTSDEARGRRSKSLDSGRARAAPRVVVVEGASQGREGDNSFLPLPSAALFLATGSHASTQSHGSGASAGIRRGVSAGHQAPAAV